MFVTVKGYDNEGQRPVLADLGWEESGGYWYTVYVRDGDTEEELRGMMGVASLPELIDLTRDYVTWDRRLYQNVRDMAVRDWVEKMPASDPVVKILAAVR